MSKAFRLWWGVWILMGLVWVPSSHADKVGFIETFALSKRRSRALKKLIPNTRDYFYFHALHYQTTGQLKKVDALLALWDKKFPNDSRCTEIEHRQALLKYKSQPKKTLRYLRDELSLSFQDHAPITHYTGKPRPTSYRNDKLRQTHLDREFKSAQTSGSTNAFTESTLYELAGRPMTPAFIKELLGQLRRPDYPGLVDLIVTDLKARPDLKFGAMAIHKMLLLSQLQALQTRRPALANDSAFVKIYIARLLPHAYNSTTGLRDQQTQDAYLSRLWSYVKGLSSSHNGLKRHVLHHILRRDQRQDRYRASHLLMYLKMPQAASYTNQSYIQRMGSVGSQTYSSWTKLAASSKDQALVRSYLTRLLQRRTKASLFRKYLRPSYLRQVQIEAMLLAGASPRRWSRSLTPAAYKALKERVELRFAPTNKTRFGSGETVRLSLVLKNVPQLWIKVYRLNSKKFYQTGDKGLDLQLDGMIAHSEKRRRYRTAPIRRKRRSYRFPRLRRRGVYAIDFIGGGKLIRAVIQKGALYAGQQLTASGHQLTIFDDKGRQLKQASVWLGDQQYRADARGHVYLPMTNQRNEKTVYLQDGDFAYPFAFTQEQEDYKLQVGFYVDREALLKNKRATVLFRPRLTMAGLPTSLALLHRVHLQIKAVDRFGIKTLKTIENIRLHDDKEGLYRFRVPPHLASITFRLWGRVYNVSQRQSVKLHANKTFKLNSIDNSAQLSAWHLQRVANGIILSLLDRAGHGLARRRSYIEFKIRGLNGYYHQVLQTDAKGQIALRVKDVVFLRVRNRRVSRKWRLRQDKAPLPERLHGDTATLLKVPYLGRATKPLRSEWSLLERRGKTYASDAFEKLKLKDGYLEIEGLSPGDYELNHHPTGQSTVIHIVKSIGGSSSKRARPGAPRGWLRGRHRMLPAPRPHPLHITRIRQRDGKLQIQLGHHTKTTRVHVIAARFFPKYSLYDNLEVETSQPSTPHALQLPTSSYGTARKLSQEHLYILARKNAKTYPGNMLPRPGLLLQPWAHNIETNAGGLGGFGSGAGGGGGFGGRGLGRRGVRSPRVYGGYASIRIYPPNLDYLRHSSKMLANLQPNAQGIVSISLSQLKHHPHLRIIAVDGDRTAFRQWFGPNTPLQLRDIRLRSTLPSQKHFAARTRVRLVRKGQTVLLTPRQFSRHVVIDSLSKAYALLQNINNTSSMQRFRFITSWPSMSTAQKQKAYSRYACHELNFFLYQKDQAFFKRVVKPYLQNKLAKDFMDRWLLSMPLDAYVKPARYARLNVVERILLGRRLRSETAAMRRSIKHLYEAKSTDATGGHHLSMTVLQSGRLDLTSLSTQSAGKDAYTQADRKDGFNIISGGLLPSRNDVEIMKPDELISRYQSVLSAQAKRLTPLQSQRLQRLIQLHKARQRLARLYQPVKRTKELAETYYYQVHRNLQKASLIKVNPFWRDVALHRGGPFLSAHLAHASSHTAEMLLALAFLDLPFRSKGVTRKHTATTIALTTRHRAMVYTHLLREVPPSKGQSALLVRQHCYRLGRRFTMTQGKRTLRPTPRQFEVHTRIGCEVVVTNPSPTEAHLDVLLQIPRGSLPIRGTKPTDNRRIKLAPYRTFQHQYFFTFPKTGRYEHFPLHVSQQGRLAAFARPHRFDVIKRRKQIDKNDWTQVAAHGTKAQVVATLTKRNLHKLALYQIAWRMKDKDFFLRVTRLLNKRHVYVRSLWKYGLYHQHPPTTQTYLLRSRRAFVKACGLALKSPLLTIEPFVEKLYQHLEYRPLHNARTHKYGKHRTIENSRFHRQYTTLLRLLSYQRQLRDKDRLALAYYLLLQGRTYEALLQFRQVRPERLVTRLQYDYFRVYLDVTTRRLARARKTAERYKQYPVMRWRQKFREALRQLDEIEGRNKPQPTSQPRSGPRLASRAGVDREASFDFTISGNTVRIEHQGVRRFRIHYHLMNVELLFSRNPFVLKQKGPFAALSPQLTQRVKARASGVTRRRIPRRMRSKNTIIEVVAAGQRKSTYHYANALHPQLMSRIGQLRVLHRRSKRPLAKVYVKVYAKNKRGHVSFYKDGYTDLRGRFDYASLNPTALNDVKRFAILIASKRHGTAIREIAPPNL